MRRFPWDILLALLAGLGLGIAYAWIISPQNLTDSNPVTLRADFKDQFRSSIAAAYAATGNLPRAQARLELLGDNDLQESLNAQAQREIANSQFTQADQLAALALALGPVANNIHTNTPVADSFVPATTEAGIGITPLPSPADIPFDFTETPTGTEIETQPAITPQTIPNTVAPRATRTPQPTQGAPFQLTALDTVCDPNLPNNLLQVTVFNANRRQLAGIKIVVTWDSGEDEFFTGLKPELGNGYADFLMTPDTSYSVQLGIGSETATELTPPTCQAPNGDSFLGGYKITFQQP